MPTWKNLRDFCSKRGYDIIEGKKLFGSICREVGGIQEVDLDRVDEVIALKARPMNRPARRIWTDNSPAKIERHIERKQSAIAHRREHQIVAREKLKVEKNPRQKRILAKRIHDLQVEVSGFEIEIQKCVSRIFELTIIKDDDESTEDESKDSE
ncbi:MAG: hypothetical protein JXL67_13380 [Calditrichaeota bacterium]|nr:hypothetical protein [Calditrichota bacterium]